MHAPRDLGLMAAATLARLRNARPRVHCITNAVAQSFTANALLALGAVPSMTVSVAEVGDFVSRADALLVNLGTLDPEREEATGLAVAAAQEKGVPWLLDPVFVDRSPPRAAFAATLLVRRPRALRLNGAEFATLAGVAAGPEALASFARDHDCVVGLTGGTDLVADKARLARLANGDPMMARVTAMGCAASAVTAACLAVEADPWCATVAGLAIVGICGELAAREAKGPGSLASGILDTLYQIAPDTLAAHARLS